MHDRDLLSSISINSVFLETFLINDQKIFHFVKFIVQKVPSNISYPVLVNKIDGYLDAEIGPNYVRYITTRDKLMQYKNKIINRIQGYDIHSL